MVYSHLVYRLCHRSFTFAALFLFYVDRDASVGATLDSCAADEPSSVYERYGFPRSASSSPQCNTGSCHSKLNYRPIVGILCQATLPTDETARGSSYITASYVKFVEGGGARVIPIRLNRTEEEYTKIFYSINGLLLPGGKGDLATSLFSRAAKIFYDLALKANDAGDYFPIWGTCLGLQQLAFFTANKNELTMTNTLAVALPVKLTPEARTSRLFKDFPENVLWSLEHENITGNFHKYSLSMQNYTSNPVLQSFYTPLTTNTDGNTEFISTMEAKHYPFYAVQWHPEKGSYEWIQKPGMVHSSSSKLASFHMALFFVSEAMKSHHQFPSLEEEEKALIYNFNPMYRGTLSIFMENYYFD